MLEELLEIQPYFPIYLCMKIYRSNLTSPSSLALSLPTAERCLEVLRNQNRQWVPVSKRA